MTNPVERQEKLMRTVSLVVLVLLILAALLVVVEVFRHGL
jgi:hypothetical protein